MPLDVVVTLPLEPALAERIVSTDSGVHVRMLGSREGLARRGALYPSELQETVAVADVEAALPEADVLFANWSGPLARIANVRALTPRLRWVQLMTAGAELVPRELLAADIAFTTSAGLASTPIAETVLAYMLMFRKGWPAAGRNQQAHEYVRYIPGELRGSTVGVVGMGSIGREVARLARALGCRVIGMRRSGPAGGADEFAEEVVHPSDLDYLLGASDFVVLAAPLTEETRGLIDAEQLRVMRSDGYLINVSRGPLVDEAALVEALRAGVIAGAAIDVFTQEPLPSDSPLWALDNVILTPHIAAGTPRYFEAATDIFCDNLRRFLSAEPLVNLVDPARGY